MIAIVISCLALAISLAPYIHRWLTKGRPVYVVLGDGFSHDDSHMRQWREAAAALRKDMSS